MGRKKKLEVSGFTGVIADTTKLAHSVVRMMDPDSPGTGADVAKAARRLVPLSNALGVGQALNYLVE